MRRSGPLMTCVVVLAVFATTAAGQTPAPATAPGALAADTRLKLTQSLARGAEYLRQQQGADGIWENHAGITAMAATALLRQPGISPGSQLSVVGTSLDALVKLAKPDGGIYEKMIPHYVTAVSTMALVAGGRPDDRPIIERARRYLADHLLDEGEGIARSDKFYGGMGYGGTSRGGSADIISLEFGLRAMKEAGLAADDPAFQKALVFLQRTQNNSETNDQGWASNDGGFVYYPGYSQVGPGTQSYGSGTYAGLLSYIWANLSKTDPRTQATLKWIRNNYTLEENPGIGQKTLYYYYMVFAKALKAAGEDVIVDARGQRHNWREELGQKLLGLQFPEGYWVNTHKAEMQDNKVLVTAFTMMAIEAILE